MHMGSSSNSADIVYEACFSPRRCAIMHVCMQGLLASSKISLHPPPNLGANAKHEEDKESIEHADTRGTEVKPTWHDLVCGNSDSRIERSTLIPALPRLGPEVLPDLTKCICVCV